MMTTKDLVFKLCEAYTEKVGRLFTEDEVNLMGWLLYAAEMRDEAVEREKELDEILQQNR